MIRSAQITQHAGHGGTATLSRSLPAKSSCVQLMTAFTCHPGPFRRRLHKQVSKPLQLEAAPAGCLGSLLDPLDGLLAAVVHDASVELHELLPIALLVALEVVAAGALLGVHRVRLADAVRDVSALTQGHVNGADGLLGWVAAVLLREREQSRTGAVRGLSEWVSWARVVGDAACAASALEKREAELLASMWWLLAAV